MKFFKTFFSFFLSASFKPWVCRKVYKFSHQLNQKSGIFLFPKKDSLKLAKLQVNANAKVYKAFYEPLLQILNETLLQVLSSVLFRCTIVSGNRTTH